MTALRLVLPLVLAAAGAAGAQAVQSAPGAVLRALDKVSGETVDLDLSRGQAGRYGRLSILLDDCRYRPEDPAADAWAHVTIRDRLVAEPVFSGWMVASSPGLSALDHARYDVWLLRCAIE